MALQDRDFPVPWTSGLPAAWPISWIVAGKAARERVWRLLGSDLFAFGLGGVLWSALIFFVVRSPG